MFFRLYIDQRGGVLLPVSTTPRSAALYSQVRRGHEPHAGNALTIGLTRSIVSREGLERVTIILDLVPVYIHLHTQFPGEGSRTCGSS